MSVTGVRATRFYEALFSFEKLVEDSRMCAFSVAGRQVLLLFKKGASTAPIPIPGGIIPPSDGDGNLHSAFSIAGADLAG